MKTSSCTIKAHKILKLSEHTHTQSSSCRLLVHSLLLSVTLSNIRLHPDSQIVQTSVPLSLFLICLFNWSPVQQFPGDSEVLPQIKHNQWCWGPGVCVCVCYSSWQSFVSLICPVGFSLSVRRQLSASVWSEWQKTNAPWVCPAERQSNILLSGGDDVFGPIKKQKSIWWWWSLHFEV